MSGVRPKVILPNGLGMFSADLKKNEIMNRCTVIDRLEDEYGIKPENLTEREKAIIGLCTNQFLENEEQVLSIANVVGQSEQLVCYTCKCTKGNKPKGDNFCNMCDHYF